MKFDFPKTLALSATVLFATTQMGLTASPQQGGEIVKVRGGGGHMSGGHMGEGHMGHDHDDWGHHGDWDHGGYWGGGDLGGIWGGGDVGGYDEPECIGTDCPYQNQD